MRPRDPYLRRAACAFWAGNHEADSAAWALPGPVQTVYRAELYAILVALEVFRGDVEIVSDCKGVVDEAERIRGGGGVDPTSRHADLWVRYSEALGAQGIRSVLLRWVPSHEEEGSDRISPGIGQGTTEPMRWPMPMLSASGRRRPRRRGTTAEPSRWRPSRTSTSGSLRLLRRPTHRAPKDVAPRPAMRALRALRTPPAGSAICPPSSPGR